jgi:hypothetical protein
MRKLNSFELSIVVHGEVYTNDPTGIEDYLKSQVLKEIHMRQSEIDGEIEIITARDEKRDQYTLRATGRAWTDEPDEEPEDLEYCSNCAESFNYCLCGDQATAPTTQEIIDALPDVEAIV